MIIKISELEYTLLKEYASTYSCDFNEKQNKLVMGEHSFIFSYNKSTNLYHVLIRSKKKLEALKELNELKNKIIKITHGDKLYGFRKSSLSK